MPQITLDNDPTVYTVQVKAKGTIAIDALELQGQLIELGYEFREGEMLSDADRQKWVKAAKAVMFMPNGGADITRDLADNEVFAFAFKVAGEYGRAGNASGPSQTLRRPTVSSSDRPGSETRS